MGEDIWLDVALLTSVVLCDLRPGCRSAAGFQAGIVPERDEFPNVLLASVASIMRLPKSLHSKGS